jgi:ribosomal protein L35
MGKGAKTPKGILKRGRISATGKLRFSRTGKQKLNGHERGEVLQDRRGHVFVGPNKIKLLEKQLHRRLKPVK